MTEVPEGLNPAGVRAATSFRRAAMLRPKAFAALAAFVVLLLLLVPVQGAYCGDRSIVLYRIGDDAPQAWSYLRQRLEAKGYQVIFYQGETTVEGHVEKVNAVNRGPGKTFLSVELVSADQTRVMVAMSDARKGEGRFLTIDQIPDRFAKESERLAGSVAGQFKVKAKRLPLFPLLGVDMPGIFVRIQFKEGEFEETVNRLTNGIERYFTERTTK